MTYYLLFSFLFMGGDTGKPFPAELAFTTRQLSVYYLPQVSPDGKWVAHVVVSPT